ncbi:hypothetical protein AAZX31_05G154500 [Glycine max]
MSSSSSSCCPHILQNDGSYRIKLLKAEEWSRSISRVSEESEATVKKDL